MQSMNIPFLLSILLISLSGAQEPKPADKKRTGQPSPSPRELHKSHRTQLTTRPAPEVPPKGELELTSYQSPAGRLHAYISPDPGDGKKHPLIIWLVGGFSNSISEYSWLKADPANDQSAQQYRAAGLPMMYPSLRGGNDNPGDRECMFGEVNDVIAAAEHAAKLPWVDSSRIYLGGHSTGGTLALLVAGNSDLFRAVISVEPVHSVINYGAEYLPFDPANKQELAVRAPVFFLSEIKSQTLVIAASEGNLDAVRILKKNCSNPSVRFVEIPKADHFTLCAPFNDILAKKLLGDTGAKWELNLSKEDVDAGVKRMVLRKEKETETEPQPPAKEEK